MPTIKRRNAIDWQSIYRDAIKDREPPLTGRVCPDEMVDSKGRMMYWQKDKEGKYGWRYVRGE